MAAQPPIIFGRYKGNTTPQQTTVRGETNWFTVPSGWFMQPAAAYDGKSAPNEVVASPNGNFTAPVYYCCLDDSGQVYAFQDLMVERILTFRPAFP